MMGPPMGETESRVLLLAPTVKDAAMTQRILASMEIECLPCQTVAMLCSEIDAGAGTVLLTEEASETDSMSGLVEHLRQQPAWSDLPVIVLAGGGANSAAGRRAMELLGNVTVLERPVQMASLFSVVRSLLRARKRQYQIRQHLLEREQAAALIQQNQARLGELVASEQAARGEAERVSRVKDEFLATLSHELRTPLNAILGWSLILRNPGATREDVTEGLETIERNARMQAQIIEDLLDMSRIISGKIRLDMQRIDLSDVIRSALETVRPAADAKEINIDAAIGPLAATVRADPARLQQVFWNLLSNAIKFTPKGGRVEVRLGRMASHLDISVSDTGEGIRADFLPRVFDRFQQADASTTRRHGGLGLGLAIAKQLVELHGGTLQAFSPGPGRGSTFTVSLPLTAPQPGSRPHASPRPEPERDAPMASAAMAPVSLAGLRALVVDDEPDSREMIKRLLEDCQARVATAASVADAIVALEQETPDVLISDIGMPGEDGYALIQRVRSLNDVRCRVIPAIALTAYARSEDRAKALSLGFQTHLSKPVEPAELVAAIARLTSIKLSPPARRRHL